MVMGSPRKHDRSNLAELLLAWARLPDSMNLNCFCTSLNPEIHSDYLLAMSKEDEDLSRAYKIAKTYIAGRREEANSAKEMSDAAYNKNHHVYDKFFVDANREEKTFDHDLAKEFERFKKRIDKEIESSDALGLQAKFDAVLDQLSALSSTRKMDDKSTSNEQKS
jgi:hypothetical protein